ncbi:MAG: hypothetical protein R8G66_27410 [Cytophagales bacterium]|nr:hypothetical protein [Cytophagales bacterium]
MFYYQLHNLIIASSFELNELEQTQDTSAHVTVTMVKQLPEIKEVIKEGKYYRDLDYRIGAQGQIQLTFQGLFDSMIHQDSQRIYVKMVEGSSLQEMKTHLLGTVLSFLLLNKSQFPIHASAISTDEGAILFMGHSGVGKSTTATLMMRAGFPIISDDVCLIELQKEQAWVSYAFPQVKLWEESTAYFNIPTKELEIVSNERAKYKVPLTKKVTQNSFPIKAIFEIDFNDQLKGIQIRSKTTMDKLQALLKHTYRHHAVKILGLEKAHFEYCSKLIEAVPIYHLQRPKDLNLLDELVDRVVKQTQITS